MSNGIKAIFFFTKTIGNKKLHLQMQMELQYFDLK